MALERIVGSLKMKCFEHDSGCEWQGELRDMKLHNAVCKYQQASKDEGTKWEELREELNALKEKAREVDILKEKVREVDVLKEKVTTAERLITLIILNC